MAKAKGDQYIGPQLLSVEAVVHGARRTMVRQARLDAAGRVFLWSSIVAAAAIVGVRLAGQSSSLAWLFVLVAVVGTVLWAIGHRSAVPNSFVVAKRIDQRLGLKDRLASGYELAHRARSEGCIDQSPFTSLILKDAQMAAQEARGSLRMSMRVPRRVVAGAAVLAMSAAFWIFVLPGGAPQRDQVSREQREQIKAFNESLARTAEAIKAIPGLDDKQEKEILDALRSVQISQDELNNMSRAEVIRRLRDANAKIKLPESMKGGVAVRQAIEDKLRAIAEMDQVQQQLAEIETINARQAVINLGDGRTALAANIKLESSDLQIDAQIVASAAKPGEAEQEYRRRMEMAEARAKAERDAIKKFLAKPNGEEIPAGEAQKLTAMMANDTEFQGRVMEAIKDPTGKKLDAMRGVYRRQLDREFESENIPRGLRQQLNTYLGPGGTRESGNK